MGIWSLLPAAVTILVAIVFRKTATALFLGIVSGALLLSGAAPEAFFSHMVLYLKASFFDVERLKIVVFILLIGGLLEIISVSGAYITFSRVLGRYLNTPRKARMATWSLSFGLFFDDYANVLISGTSMRSVTDRNHVSPAMLAYMVDVLAVLASVMLVSTWAAFEGSLMADAARSIHLPGNMTSLFLQATPFHFYTFLAVFLTLLVAWSGKWFGRRFDNRTYRPAAESRIKGKNARFIHVLAPFLTLLGAATLGLFGSGYYFLRKSGQPFSLMNLLGHAPTMHVLLASALSALTVAVYLLKRDRVLGRGTVRVSFHRGILSMISIGMVILLATGLSRVSQDLGTGTYLAAAGTRFFTPALLPCLSFFIALAITISTGFSWSSMAIVMPVVYRLAVDLPAYNGADPIAVISAAVITGAVAGEHLIPYSEKAVMTAAACGIPPVYHTRTQILQSIAAVCAAALGFLLLGIGWPLLLCYGLPALLLFLSHHFLAR